MCLESSVAHLQPLVFAAEGKERSLQQNSFPDWQQNFLMILAMNTYRKVLVDIKSYLKSFFRMVINHCPFSVVLEFLIFMFSALRYSFSSQYLLFVCVALKKIKPHIV